VSPPDPPVERLSVAPGREESETLIEEIGGYLARALGGIDDRLALPPGAAASLESLPTPLPETGIGAPETLRRLFEWNLQAGANTAGPRCFHFVIGGATPAAHGADLLATAFDALAYTWVTSPVGVSIEVQALGWLKELFGLPAAWPGIMVTGGTMANFVGLAAGRQWWGARHGVDVAARGLAGLPAVPVFSSGYVHASTLKVLSMLGIGRDALTVCRRDDAGRVDLERLRRELAALDGRPALVVVNAGEPNTGDLDPVEEMIELAREHDAWVHVDGAFGLFARLSPRTEHLVRGVERADSVAVDGHKWLNVPYDSGYAFVRDHKLLAEAFRYTADYLPDPDDPRPTLGAIGPESSRRARGFATWATLAAYGARGHREIVEHCLDLARHLARRIDQAPDLALASEVVLNVVAFRYDPGSLDDARVDELNRRLGEALLDDGRFLVGTSRLGARTILRPAFSNWRTTTADLDELVAVVRELGARLHTAG
jgi:glutamate/tyrosine decarboxylase-like PLP-dependent enzyme